MSSHRIYVPPDGKSKRRRNKRSNCLFIKVILDKAILRGSKFLEMNLRIMDEWNYIPRHSKVCVFLIALNRVMHPCFTFLML